MLVRLLNLACVAFTLIYLALVGQPVRADDDDYAGCEDGRKSCYKYCDDNNPEHSCYCACDISYAACTGKKAPQGCTIAEFRGIKRLLGRAFVEARAHNPRPADSCQPDRISGVGSVAVLSEHVSGSRALTAGVPG